MYFQLMLCLQCSECTRQPGYKLGLYAINFCYIRIIVVFLDVCLEQYQMFVFYSEAGKILNMQQPSKMFGTLLSYIYFSKIIIIEHAHKVNAHKG